MGCCTDLSRSPATKLKRPYNFSRSHRQSRSGGVGTGRRHAGTRQRQVARIQFGYEIAESLVAEDRSRISTTPRSRPYSEASRDPLRIRTSAVPSQSRGQASAQPSETRRTAVVRAGDQSQLRPRGAPGEGRPKRSARRDHGVQRAYAEEQDGIGSRLRRRRALRPQWTAGTSHRTALSRSLIRKGGSMPPTNATRYWSRIDRRLLAWDRRAIRPRRRPLNRNSRVRTASEQRTP